MLSVASRRLLGQIDPCNPENFVRFEVSDDAAWEIQVGTVKARVPLTEMGFVFSAGRVLVTNLYVPRRYSARSVADLPLGRDEVLPHRVRVRFFLRCCWRHD